MLHFGKVKIPIDFATSDKIIHCLAIITLIIRANCQRSSVLLFYFGHHYPQLMKIGFLYTTVSCST